MEQKTAREVLLIVFERHLQEAGEHAHYINGVVLYPGFELDQLCSYFLALKRYLDKTKDVSIWKEERLEKGLKVLWQKLLLRQDALSGLFRTFLDPSDDPVRYPFLIYNNALVYSVLLFMARLQNAGLWASSPDCTFDAEAKAAKLKEAIYRHGVVQGPTGKMFAWSVDARGNHELYDNPPGSLMLLPYYGFCSQGDAIYRNTVEWIFSAHNTHYHDGKYRYGTGSRHGANPWPLGAASALLAGERDAADFFRQASMDGFLACETIYPHNGRAATGLAFASAAGFLGYALFSSLQQKK